MDNENQQSNEPESSPPIHPPGQVISPDAGSESQPAQPISPTQPPITDQNLPQAPMLTTDQVTSPIMPQNIKRRRPKMPLIATGLVILLLVIAGGAYAAFGHKTSYQTVIQEFVTAMENKDKTKADSLESPAAKALLQKDAGSTSFYNVCQQSGVFCTATFNSSYLAKATKAYKDYTASNGTKGKELVYTINESLSGTPAGGQGCSSNSTSTLTIAAVPKGNSWQIDYIDEGVNANANLCLSPGGNSSTSN